MAKFTWNRWESRIEDESGQDRTKEFAGICGHVTCAGNRAVDTFVHLETLQVYSFGGLSCGRNLHCEVSYPLTVSDIHIAPETTVVRIFERLGLPTDPVKPSWWNDGERRTSLFVGGIAIERSPCQFARASVDDARRGAEQIADAIKSAMLAAAF
jgi:hypothetical protein